MNNNANHWHASLGRAGNLADAKGTLFDLQDDLKKAESLYVHTIRSSCTLTTQRHAACAVRFAVRKIKEQEAYIEALEAAQGIRKV